MASKRYLESVNPVIFSKLPRQETEPTSSFPSSKIQSKFRPVPNPDSENHFNYKGSYFTCLLQSPRGPEQPVACWSPAPTYLHYGPGAMSQPVPAEGSVVDLLLYPSESPGTRKGKDSLSQEQLMARKKLDRSKCPVPVKKPVVPKPVYAAPACFLAPRMAPPLGARVESLQQSPGEANWALPPATHPLHPGEPHKKVPFNPSLPLLSSLVLPAKEKLGSPVASSHYYATFDKYRPPPSTLFLEASSSTAYSQKKVPDIPSLSPDSWPRLQLPDASLANHEMPEMCYPPPPYPLASHRAAPLCHPPAPTVGEPSALPSFSFVENREPFPSSYLKPQAPRSYFPSPLDTCVPRTVGASVLVSPPAKSVAVLRNADLPKDVELPRHPGYPSFTFNPGDASTFHTSFARPESGCEQHQVESLPWQVASRHSSAFQPVCTPEKLSGDSNGLMETFCRREESWEKPKEEEQEPPYLGRGNTSPAPQDTHLGEQVISIIVGEGNVHEAQDPTKELVPPSPSVTPPKGMEDMRDNRAFSSSPPMPVIHNVFSLAPFRDYLEKTKGSGHILFCMENLWGDPQPQNTGGSQEPAPPRDVSVASSPRSGSTMDQSQEESCYRRAPKKPKPMPQEPGSGEGSPRGVGTEELPSDDDMALDLSLRKRPSSGNPQELISCAGETLDQDVEKEKEAAREKVRVGEGAQPQLLDVGSGDRSKFQSSATFMVKKFKLPLSLLHSTEPPHQVGSPHAPQPSQPSSTPTPTPPASSPSNSSPVPPPGPQPSTISGPNPAQPPLPKVPSSPGKEGLSLAKQFGDPPPKTPSGQYFTTLHTWLCDTISRSVSRSSPELLQQWLKKAESAEELGEMPKSLPKPKNGSKAPTPQKPSKGKEIWLSFQDVAGLLANLLSQLQAFMSSCPFPHVVRAGAIFIPIHVVKERLFPKLPGTSVDLVLQKHKVELRPTTLSEERHLRDLELKSCTSRMLKLLALKQLPEIYPDLLNLHWHNSIRQQLGSPGMETLKTDGKATAGRSEKKDALKNMPGTTATWEREQKGPQRC